jgi:CBS domain-containing protein
VVDLKRRGNTVKDLKVRDLMTRSVVTVEPADNISEAARRLARHRVSGAPVVEQGKVIGMITESDIVRAVAIPEPTEGGLTILAAISDPSVILERSTKRTVADVMSTLVVEASPQASIWQAAAEMEERGVNRLPVVEEDGTLVGIISRADLVRLMAESPQN